MFVLCRLLPRRSFRRISVMVRWRFALLSRSANEPVCPILWYLRTSFAMARLAEQDAIPQPLVRFVCMGAKLATPYLSVSRLLFDSSENVCLASVVPRFHWQVLKRSEG